MQGLGHDFPTFPGCDAVFLAGPLTPTGRDYIDSGEGKIRVINVVPITHAERDLLAMGVKEEDLKAIDKEIKDIVVEAAKFAEDAPEPEARELYTDVLVGSY